LPGYEENDSSEVQENGHIGAQENAWSEEQGNTLMEAPENEKNGIQNEQKGLEAYLGNVALVSDIDNFEGENDYVVLMTLHSAKGLEFPVVFIPGFEEGVFPGLRSMSSEDELEEERRLCYVGITRARERLYLTSTYSRTLFGNTTYNKCSRFIKEIPKELIETKGRRETPTDTFVNWKGRTGAGVRSGYASSTNARGFNANGGNTEGFGISKGSTVNLNSKSSSSAFNDHNSFSHPQKDIAGSSGKTEGTSTIDYKTGDNVVHKKFGVGKIISVKLDEGDYMLEIEFRNSGMKRLMAAFANLVKL